MANKVFIPLNGNKEAEQALELLKQWLACGQVSEVILARVEPETPVVALDYPLPTEAVLAADDKKIREAQSYLDEITARVDWRGVAHRSIVRLGDPTPTLARLAEEQKVDLVIASIEKPRGLRLLGRKNADRLLRAFSVPVLVLSQTKRADAVAPRTCELRQTRPATTPTTEPASVCA
jgi:nucleotide-binding universal stress UspA family protein